MASHEWVRRIVLVHTDSVRPKYFGRLARAFQGRGILARFRERMGQAAGVKLGRAKGYRFVGCNRLGYNAFFVKDELARDLTPEASVESCFRHPKVRWGMSERVPSVRDFPWIEV
jgi:hypothetical protein